MKCQLLRINFFLNNLVCNPNDSLTVGSWVCSDGKNYPDEALDAKYSEIVIVTGLRRLNTVTTID